MITLVLVTGSGRSGTSSVAGTMKRLGMHVPQPEVEADERNPRGYYEPLWVADFHKQWLEDVPVRTIDTRPDADEVAMATVTPEREETLRAWLVAELAGRADGDVVVVKETRAYWVYRFWERVVAAVGADVEVRLASLTMLRHPTQVVRSRDSAYLSGRSDAVRLQRETANVAAWMNSVFVTERATRGNPRAFVPYVDLIGDWRAAMTRACGQLGVETGDLTAPHAVDDFVTTSLNRSSDTWEGLTVPDGLRDLAEQTWAAAQRLVVEPGDRDATATLDALQAEYAELHTAAAAIAVDDTAAQVRDTRRRIEGRLDKKNARISQLRGTVEELRARVAELEGTAGSTGSTGTGG